jgi:hypothetical protein
MRYKKIFLTVAFAVFMMGGAFVSSSQAQHRRIIVYRPVYSRPFFRWRTYDPFWYQMYETPYQRYQEERYYAESNLRDKQKDLRKHREKYARDGYLTPKEREKLAKDQRKLEEARERASQYRRYY